MGGLQTRWPPPAKVFSPARPGPPKNAQILRCPWPARLISLPDIFMNWLTQLLTEESVARTVILLGVAGAAGAALGKIRIGGVSLGVAGVLFVGLFLGYLKLSVDHHVLEFVREFGLIIFVYTLGLQIGPGFFGS